MSWLRHVRHRLWSHVLRRPGTLLLIELRSGSEPLVTISKDCLECFQAAYLKTNLTACGMRVEEILTMRKGVGGMLLAYPCSEDQGATGGGQPT